MLQFLLYLLFKQVEFFLEIHLYNPFILWKRKK